MRNMLEAVHSVLRDPSEEMPMTIRHLFYALVSRKVIAKTEKEYQVLCQRLSTWRKAGLIPYNVFADGTRVHLSDPSISSSLDEALRNTASVYRKNYWIEQPLYVEVWLEKDAISGVLYHEAAKLGVPVFVCRGFASLSALHQCAQEFREQERRGKRCLVLYFGDHDPSGVAIDKNARESMRDLFGVNVEFRRVAVTPQQIDEHDLPTRPPKATDSRGKGWVGECVEVDAFSSKQLRKLCREAIKELIDPKAWESMRIAEEEERKAAHLVPTILSAILAPEVLP